MTDASSRWQELDSLLDLVLDGLHTEADSHRLNDILRSNEEACGHYIGYVHLHGRLLWGEGRQKVASAEGSGSRGQVSETTLPLSLESGRGAGGEGDLQQSTFSNSPQPTLFHEQKENSNSYFPLPVSIILDDSSPLSSLPSPLYIAHPFLFSNLFALLVIGLGMLGAWFYQIDIPNPLTRNERSVAFSSKASNADHLEFVGHITGMVDVQWSDPQTATVHGANVPLGRKFALSSGLMEITYNSGAKVILQGPVTYKVDSRDGGFLSIGKLTAKLEKKTEDSNPQSLIPNPSLSTIHYPLFTIKTPTAVITDLGTEFGVEVDKNGTTTSHVFQGTVKFAAVKDGVEDESNAVVLNKDESIRAEKLQNAEKMSIILSRVNVDQKSFARRLVGPLQVIDLLDIVAGGTGRGNLRERGIDPTSGMEDPLFASKRLTSDSRYKPITWGRGLIDGVFVPNGKDGPVQLDSVGHFFDQFPATSGMTWGSIWPRTANLKRVPFSLTEQMKTSDYWIYSMGSGRQYMPKRLGLLALHPNVGITFNLDAIRNLHQSERPARFRALAAVAIPEKTQLDWQRGRSDIWVFVDGQLKLNKMRLEDKDAPVSLDIVLGPRDHFLTLVGTDGGDTQAWDLLVLGDPLLEMLPTNDKEVETEKTSSGTSGDRGSR